MDSTKKEAVTGGTVPTSQNTSSSSTSIAQVQPQNQLINEQNEQKDKRFRNSKKCKVLSAHAKVNTLAIKCYEEQLPWGRAALITAIRATDKKLVQILAIFHDRDIITDGIWVASVEKGHWHIILRIVDPKVRIRVMQLLRQLNIYFRPGIDDSLWQNHGVETVGNFAGYATYLTHDTDEAVRDGKEPYSMDEIVSNLTVDEIMQVREGYIRLSDKRKVTQEELVLLDRKAFELGRELGDFDVFYNNLSFAIRSNAKMKTIRESYTRGVDELVREGYPIIRLCIFIPGGHNLGKTYASAKALEKMGLNYLFIRGGGTGKFDKLKPSHDAILIDDGSCPNLLNMSDNNLCFAYKRNRDNPVWAGRILVVTSNKTFEEWVDSCGIKCLDYSSMQKRVSVYSPGYTNYLAAMSRFYICKIVKKNGVHELGLVQPSDRGSVEEQRIRLEMFLTFQKYFNEIISQYRPEQDKVDYSDYIMGD